MGRELRLAEAVGARDYLRAGRGRVRQYAFDVVLAPGASQAQTYASTAAPLVHAVLAGQNASVFAYGATGSGKTHTMLGTTDEPGIMVLALEELFEQLRGGNCEATVHISMLEIYCEQVHDLLCATSGAPKSLAVRESSSGRTTVAGLTRHAARDAREVMGLLHRGNAARACEPTRANQTSSRSHAILQVEVARTDGLRGKLSLVDLAGSERALATDARTARSVEGANINKSLLALSSCITALVSGRKHVPFRNSNLTKLLRDSLGGACRTAMVACVSPAGAQFSESSNTLHWADKAKLIKCELRPAAPLPLPEPPATERPATATASRAEARAEARARRHSTAAAGGSGAARPTSAAPRLPPSSAGAARRNTSRVSVASAGATPTAAELEREQADEVRLPSAIRQRLAALRSLAARKTSEAAALREQLEAIDADSDASTPAGRKRKAAAAVEAADQEMTDANANRTPNLRQQAASQEAAHRELCGEVAVLREAGAKAAADHASQLDTLRCEYAGILERQQAMIDTLTAKSQAAQAGPQAAQPLAARDANGRSSPKRAKTAHGRQQQQPAAKEQPATRQTRSHSRRQSGLPAPRPREQRVGLASLLAAQGPAYEAGLLAAEAAAAPMRV